jgi:hypothetical protein
MSTTLILEEKDIPFVGVQQIALDRAVICAQCDSISDLAEHGDCPRCAASHSLHSLQRLLNREPVPNVAQPARKRVFKLVAA